MSELFQNRVGRVVEAGRVDFLTRPVQAPGPGQVVIRIKASALCGSDLHTYKALHPSVPLPATIGHEFSGDIAVVGEGVVNLQVGDRVTCEPSVHCGVCPECLQGRYGYCEQLRFIYRDGDGALADYITVGADSVFPLPQGMSYEAGALIEPLAVATHAVRRAGVEMGDKVLVLGAGAIGIFVAALCRRCGAAEVLVCDYSDFRLDMAKRQGATAAVNPGAGQSLAQAVREVSGGAGMDKTFECVGREATFVQAMESLRKGGLATVVGIFEQPAISIPAMLFINNEITVQGAQGYCWDFPVAMDMAKTIDLDAMVTHTFPLEQLQTALDTSLDRGANSIKVVLKPQQEDR